GLTPEPSASDGAALPRRSPLTPRALAHTVGLALAALLTWLVWRSYRDPAFLLDFANLTLLC
ncbi:MAG: hypothetical protein ACREBP_09620, partial [Sphingomicrobium sp.]